MSGGNSHQRAVERAAREKDQSTKSVPKSAELHISAPEHTKPNVMDTGLFLATISIALTGLIALLQWNGVVTVRWIPSLLGYIFLVSFSLWAFWRWDVVQRWDKNLRVIAFIIIGVFLSGVSVGGVITQYGREHSPNSELAFSSLATNITYPKGKKIGGVEWEDGYGDLRVIIENSAEPTIQNVDLTVQVLDKGLILDMGQMSDIPGVEFRPPDDFPDLSIRLRGVDGGTSTLTMRDMWDLAGAKVPIFTNHWKVFCPRLIGKAQLRLILATSADKVTGSIPTKVKVFGTYELMPSEGSKTVKVDTVIAVKR